MINNRSEDGLVIKNRRNSCCKTNIYSNGISDFTPRTLVISPRTIPNSRTLADSEDVPNYRARVNHTKPGYPWRGKNTETSGWSQFYCCCQGWSEERGGSLKSIPLTEGFSVGKRLSSTGGGSVTINYKSTGNSPNEFWYQPLSRFVLFLGLFSADERQTVHLYT